MSFTGGLRIDGAIRGNVTTANGEAGTLVVSEQARVDGEINVSHVVVNGTVNGPIVANDFLELQAKAKVVGDLEYRTLEMQVGAVVEGRLNHVEPGTASRGRTKAGGGRVGGRPDERSWQRFTRPADQRRMMRRQR